MKTPLFLSAAFLLAMPSVAQERVEVTDFNLAGPYAVAAPFAVDTVDVKGKRFEDAALLGVVRPDANATTTFHAPAPLPSLKEQKSVGVLSFFVNNSDYVKGTISVKGPKNFKLFVDGKEQQPGDLKLAPEHHTIAIKYLAQPSDTDSISVSINAQRRVSPTLSKQHPYMVHDLTDGRRVRSISLSPTGKLVALGYQTTDRDGKSRWDYELRDVATDRLLTTPTKSLTWMPRTDAWIEDVKEDGIRVLYKVDPLTGQRTRLTAGLPDGSITMSPTEDYIIISATEEGPKEDPGVFEVLEMDDRQPGWRTRRYLVKHDLATGLSQRITFGNKGEHLYDISADGRQLLIVASYSRLERRPTEVEDIYLMDAQTLRVDTVLQCQGFLGASQFSPDGRQLLITGNPEAFDRIGCQLPAGVTPSMTENELFLMDLSTKRVTPLTKDFDPSVQSAIWSKADGMVYFSAEDRDYVNMFKLNPKTGKIEKLPIEGDYAYRWTIADHAPVVGYLSYRTLEPASGYILKQEKKKMTNQKLFDGRDALGDAVVGTCQDWNFQNSNGDTVYGRLYLPDGFDATKKYPLIVYYYGGCSPVSRYFESPYAPQMWNSLGYVAYIIEPSGATGFGQEWASRHVNTAGGTPRADGTVPSGTPAGDIIEGVKKLCQEHPFINKEKIGCMGASYGGFMTQYLQTVTDIFACAVSHAGIANHTSYWGEGYWGYNYSEVSMANSYPWSHRQLYVDQSPLFRADKIHTPLLLLHGNADTNVPLIESLQMFTALKLLGREVALVEVEGQNHHITDYAKREKWLATHPRGYYMAAM